MQTSDGMTIYYLGTDKHVILNTEAARSVLSWYPVNDCIVSLRLQTRFVKSKIIQVYVADYDAFYELQQVEHSIPKHDLKIVMGDCKVQIGADKRK